MSRVSIVLAVLLLAAAASALEVRDFTRMDQGGILTGTLVEVRPSKGAGSVEGEKAKVVNGSLSLSCSGDCAEKVKIAVPAGFDTIAANGEGGLIKVSDHDSDPLTCDAGIIDVPVFTVTVSGSTNVSIGCVRAEKIVIIQSGQVSAVSMWWTVETDLVEVTNTGEGASTHIIGPTKAVDVLASGEKATVTVRDPAAVIKGVSVGGRVFFAPGGEGSCEVSLPGPAGSACMPLGTDNASIIRNMGLQDWQGITSQSI